MSSSNYFVQLEHEARRRRRFAMTFLFIIWPCFAIVINMHGWYYTLRLVKGEAPHPNSDMVMLESNDTSPLLFPPWTNVNSTRWTGHYATTAIILNSIISLATPLGVVMSVVLRYISRILGNLGAGVPTDSNETFPAGADNFTADTFASSESDRITVSPQPNPPCHPTTNLNIHQTLLRPLFQFTPQYERRITRLRRVRLLCCSIFVVCGILIAIVSFLTTYWWLKQQHGSISEWIYGSEDDPHIDKVHLLYVGQEIIQVLMLLVITFFETIIFLQTWLPRNTTL